MGGFGLYLAVIGLILLGNLAWAGPCTDLLTKPHMKQGASDGATQSLIGYLSTLAQSGVVGDREIVRLIAGLQKGELLNPILEDEASSSTTLFIHREGLEKNLKARSINKEQILAWALATLKDKTLVKEERKTTETETQLTYKKLEFVPIAPGKFKMGMPQAQVDVELDHPFEVSDTLVTQMHWAQVMGENPAYHIDSKIYRELDHPTELTINGKVVKLQPDFPVENITWWSAAYFANLLSVAHGLKPVYNFDGIEFRDAKYQSFPTALKSESEILDAAKRGMLSTMNPVASPKYNTAAGFGSIYDAEGYRLPTEAEVEFLMRAGGKANGEYHFGDDPGELPLYAWYGKTSSSAPKAVGEFRPVVIDGKALYDVIGNLSVWTNDWYITPSISAGLNPAGAPQAIEQTPWRVVRSGGFGSPPEQLKSYSRSYGVSGCYYRGVGFRLVRSISKPHNK